MSAINTLAGEKLRELIAESNTFRGETGGPANALSHTYFGATPRLADQTAFPRPLVLIGFGEDYRWRMIAGGSQNQMRPSGTLAFYFIRNTPAAFITGDDCDYTAAEIDHMDFFGGVLDDIAEKAGLDDRLDVVGIEMREFFEVDAKYWQQLGRFYISTGVIHWGDELRTRM